MSADHWGKCPKCVRLASQSREKAELELESLYGKISAQDWIDKRNSIPSGEVEETTLREDYEIFTDETGLFYMKYSGECSVCGFSYEEKIEKQVLK